ncbi:pol [Symbiodinium sp. CCMP2456]|nr:pol [Symbiodinium sp. CCMP2456]
MAESGGDYGGVWSRCPTWDGSPLTWRAFKREMSWWISSLDLESTRKFNLAARFLMRQSGTVKQRGEEFSPEELEYQKAVTAPDPETGEEVTIIEEDLLAGLNKLLQALENLNGQSVLDRRGELRTQFYLHMARRPGERVADYATRFRTVISDMKTEGVKLPDSEVGWFFKEKLGLDALRRQLLDTALQGAEAYGTIEGECLRLFRDLHLQDPLFRRMEKGSGRMTIKRIFGGTAPSSAATSAPSTASSRRSSTMISAGSAASSRRFAPRQVQAAEAESQETLEAVMDEAGGDEPETEEQAGDSPSLEEVLQTEVQCLADEIAQAEEEGIDPAFCEALETEIEASAEALVSMREARVKLAEVRKDRGYKGPSVGNSSATSGKGRGKAAIAAKKASGKHLCFDCGLPGHWSGDPECTKPGAGLGRAKSKAAPKQAENEVHMVMSLSAALRSSTATSASEALAANVLSQDKALVGALDSACNRTCAGEDWVLGYLEELKKAPDEVRNLVLSVEERESFKFGNGATLPSGVRYRLPAVIAGNLVGIWVSCVPVASLGLLLGRDLLDGLGGVLDFGQKTLRCKLFAGRPPVPLERLVAGHLALGLIPDVWPAVTRGRWRKLGPGGVLENMARPSAAPFMRMDPRAPQALDPDLRVGGRWRRMVLRALVRFDWSREGVRLWCVKHPELRWLPFPYPSVSSVEQWKLQVDGMVASACFPRRWVGRGLFNSTTLASMTWLRSRVGLKFAFLEDPVLSGMLAAKNMPGRMTRIKNAALKEEAATLAKEADRLQVARALVGPKGGMPTLKGDLVKLAALLHTPVGDKDTIKDIRNKLRPIVNDLCNKPPDFGSGGTTLDFDLVRKYVTWALGAFGKDAYYNNAGRRPEHFECLHLECPPDAGHGPEAMFAQVLQHVMQLRMNPQPEAPDQDMDGWHFVLEHPPGSVLWRLPGVRALAADPRCRQFSLDLGRFGSKTADGMRLRLPWTRLVTSSQAVVHEFRRDRVDGQPPRLQLDVRAFPKHFSERLVAAMEDEFDAETCRLQSASRANECFEVSGAGGAVDFVQEALVQEPGLEGESETEDENEEPFLRFVGYMKRLATDLRKDLPGPFYFQERRLLLYKLPGSCVVMCVWNAAALKLEEAVGERAHLDLLIVEDALGEAFVVAHATDSVSKYQLAALIPDKSSAAVIDFLLRLWWPILGAPRQVVADQGREFVSEEFQNFCSAHSTHLWHCAVQAPWQNSPAERSGGVLKTLVAALVSEHVTIGSRDMANVVAEACAAYNADINEEGVSPLQCVTGRQPTSQGAVLNNFAGRLAEHGLIDSEPSLQQRLALRESARVGMVRLHYSKGIRRAELARSREPTILRPIQAGDTVYFWRAQKANRRGDPRVSTSSRRRRLELRRWHGPAIVLALERSSDDSAVSNAFLSFKGQVTKCALEHVRLASSLEQLSAGAWEAAIKELTEGNNTSLQQLGSAAADTVPEEEAELVHEESALVQPPSEHPDADERALQSTAAPGTPVGQLLQRPVIQRALQRAQDQPLELALGRQALARGQPADFAAELRSMMERGRKRSVTESVEPSESHPEGPPTFSRRVLQTVLLIPIDFLQNHWVMYVLQTLLIPVECDRLRGLVSEKAPDHGTWDGRWSLPARSQHELLQSLGVPLPTGVPEDAHEVHATGGRKEKLWSHMNAFEKKLWAEAAVKGWSAYVDNDAVRVLSLQESLAVRKELARKRELDRILTPRFVMTDKNDSLRTEGVNLPPAPSARLVVPGFKDRANLEGEIRRDAPTGSRLSQHLLVSLVAYHSDTWNLLSADVKVGPDIPLPKGCLAKVLKGVFGLADAPRQWWVKLSKSLEARGWQRSALDQAVWFLWDGPERKKLCGMIVSHVDDLLFGGDAAAEKSLLAAYHENLREVFVSKPRKSDVASPLTAVEHRQLRALLGSFQWLVAQLRFDLAFSVSSLQGESPPTVGTLLRANLLVREFQRNCNFELVFRGVNPYKGGLMVVTDAALGNVDVGGSAQEAPLSKVFSQACYFVVLADEALMNGQTGNFNILDMRSHRIPRVCRSSYAAETLGAEEAFDVGQLCRGFVASVRGLSLHKTQLDASINSVPLCVVVDAKDVYDKSNSDSNSFGSQKSLAFTIAWMRSVLRRPNTGLRWTSTENMWADGGTKEMDLTHMREIMASGRWSVTYSPSFVKQVSKGKRKKPEPSPAAELLGSPLDPSDPLLGHLLKLGELKGWHNLENMGVNVAYDARSKRSPEPRFSPSQFPFRSSFCRVELPTGQAQWRVLERDVPYSELPNQHELLPSRAPILVTFFTRDPVQC